MEDLYFKDVFTKTETGIDMEANRLDITCIHSNQNKFDLDSEGNLSVKSLTTVDSLPTQINFDLIYPVGSIYLTINSTNPRTLFGGTWVPFGSGRTLVGVDSTQTEFNSVEKMGGAKTVVLTNGNLPKLTGRFGCNVVGNYQLFTNGVFRAVGQIGTETGVHNTSTKEVWGIDFNAGNNEPHNNLSPYITCYMWKRTA